MIPLILIVLGILLMADPGGTPSNHDPDDDPN